MRKVKNHGIIEISLCPRCARAFYHSPVHHIKRVDPIEVIKTDCDCCRTGKGYYFSLSRRPVRREKLKSA